MLHLHVHDGLMVESPLRKTCKCLTNYLIRLGELGVMVPYFVDKFNDSTFIAATSDWLLLNSKG